MGRACRLALVPRSSRLLALVLVPALVLGAASCGQPSGDVAALVAGREITTAEVDFAADLYRFLGDVNGQGCGAPVERETPEAACARYALSNLIQESIIATYAAGHDVTVDRADAEQAVDDLEQSIGVDAFAERLEANGVTKTDVVGLAERLFLFNAVRDDLAADIPEEDLRALYEESLTYTTIHAKHILVEDEATAREIADQATPQNFGALAEEYSVDTGSAAQGGDLGPLPAQNLDQDFVAGALALQPGEISDPVQTQFGWHVIQLVEVTKRSFADAESSLRAQQATEVYAEWLLGRYADVEIEVNPRYGRIDRSTGEVVPIRSTEDPASGSPLATAATPTP